MGTHTGDSVTIAPALTLTDKEYQVMRNASIACLRKIGVETGGSNVQFAINPKNGRMVIIEMNPRVSRSSALASKATGFPIAKVAAKLAVGYTLDELQNEITKVTPASFEPTIDYVVTKIPRFTFGKGKHEGDKYVGEYKDGVRNGQGTYTWTNGQKYVGEWKDEKENGQGTMSLSNGEKYVGEFKDGRPWNITGYDKNGNIIGKMVNGVLE